MISKIKAFVKLKSRLSQKMMHFFSWKNFKKSNHFQPSKHKNIVSAIFILFSLCLISTMFYFLGYFTEKRTGFEETAQFLNSLPKSEKLQIWSNNTDFCFYLDGTCFAEDNIPQYAEFDYYVFFENQEKKIITDTEHFSNLRRYAFKRIGIQKRNSFLIKSAIVKRSNVPAKLLPAPSEFTFAIIGDSQKWTVNSSYSKTNEFYSILKNIQKFNPDFLLAMGDLTADFNCQTTEACKSNYSKWKSEVEKYVPIVYPALGNHDEGNNGRNFYRDVFSLPNNGPDQTDAIAYSFDFKNSHFVFTDSEKAHQQQKGTLQMEWLANNLKENLKRNTFFISHAPNVSRPIPKQTQQWELIFKNNVFAQFSGDTHVFCQRTISASEFSMEGGEINHFIIGNAGSMNHPYPPGCENKFKGPHFAIVKIKGPQMDLSVFDTHGVEVAKTSLTNKNYFME